MLKLKFKQGDVTADVLHTELVEKKKIYLRMLLGFKKKACYGLCQSPRMFRKYLINIMKDIGIKTLDFYPCVFIGDKVIAVAFVDNILF